MAKLFEAVAQKTAQKRIVLDDYPFSNKAFFCIDKANPLRKVASDVVRSKWFDRASMFVIFVNCLFLCFNDPLDQDPNSSRNKILSGSEVYFTAIFTVEMVFKMLAMGLARAKGRCLPPQAEELIKADPSLDPYEVSKKKVAYFGDYWNWLDFTVVMIGYIAMAPGVQNVSALRTFRVLRPLKTLSSFPGMRVITTAMMDSLGDLLNVGMLCLFFFFIFGIIGVQMYNGTMDGVCFIGENATSRPVGWETMSFQDSFDEENCALTNPIDWPENSRAELLISEGDGRSCAPIVLEEGAVIHRYCGRMSSGSGPFSGYGPSYGTGNFDNIGLAVLSIFTAITLEGWVDEMYMLFNAFGIRWFTAFYYIMLILVGSMFMLNLALAVIENAMSDAQAAEDEASAARDEQEKLTHNPADEKSEDRSGGTQEKPGISFFRGIVESSVFDLGIVMFILANTIVLAMEYHSTDPDKTFYNKYQNGLNICNYIFTAVFFLEMVFKMLGLFWREYFRESFNQFDFLIVMVSLVELVIELADLSNGSSGLSALRAFRLFRLFKLAKSWGELYKLLETLAKSVVGVGNAAMLLGVMIFIFVLLGMQLFGEPMSNPDKFPDGVPRANFETFGWSLVTVFQVLTGENWNEVLYNGIQATSFGQGVLYFVLLNVVGNYIILNIFMAILLGNFDEDDEEPEPEPKPKKQKTNKVLPTSEATGKSLASNGPSVSSTTTAGNIHSVGPKPNQKTPAKVSAATSTTPAPQISVMDLTSSGTTKSPTTNKKVSEFRLEGTSLFILGKDDYIRQKAFEIIIWPPFDNFILFLIGLSSMMLAMDEPHLDPDSGMKNFLNVTDAIITWLFIMEATIKIIAFGFVLHNHAYLRNSWNQLDFFIVVLSIVSMIGLGDQVKALRSLRALRALRPLRVLNRAPGMKLVVNSIFRAMPHIFNVTVVCMLFYVIFGIIGVQNWAGGLNVCSNPERLCKPGVAILPDHPSLNCSGDCSITQSYPGGLLCGEDVACGSTTREKQFFDRPGNGSFTLESNEFFASCKTDSDCTCNLLPTDALIEECIARAYCTFGDISAHPYNKTGLAIAPQVKNASFCQEPESRRWEYKQFVLRETWYPLPQHFDNVGNAILSVFEISSGEMWPDIMYTVIDVVGPDQPMHENFNKAVALYFIAVQVVCAFLLLNMFVGVVVEQYEQMKDGQDGDGPLVTEEQRMWLETQKLAFSAGPVRKVNEPAHPARKYLFDIVESRPFELVIMFCIMLNVITMAMRKFNQSDDYMQMLESFNYVFVVVFTVEAVIKIFALGPAEYFIRAWNRFDFTIVILSFVGMAFNLGQFATLLRVGRVARIFRLIQTNQNLRDLFMTLLFSLPSISNVASVTFLLFFIYAAFGMNIFADVKFGENLTDKANFNTFLDSILLLFRMATGESYNGVMHDVRVVEPFCSESEGNCGFPIFAPLFFLSFFIFSALLMLNLLVAIILGEYSDQEEQGHLYERVSPETIESFQLTWSQFDHKATGFMPLVKLENLIMSLPMPLGTRARDEATGKPKEIEWSDHKRARKKMTKLQCIERNGKVSFHEILSGLVANCHADIDLRGLASNPKWTEELMQSTRNGPANKFIKKANKDRDRHDGPKNLEGDPFTVEEVVSIMMLQSAWRRHKTALRRARKEQAAQKAQAAQ